jgi:hypothetical protein
MAEMKEKTMEAVLDILDSVRGTPILFTVCQRFNSHLNILLLRHLVKDKGQKGVFLTVDRPSDIMKRLLMAKKIDPGRVVFLDPISKVSGLPPLPDDKQVKFMNNPFFGEVQDLMSEEGHAKMIKEGVSFVMVDDLSALSCYIDVGTMGKLLLAMSRWKDLTVLMCADDINPQVRDKAKAVCSREVRFNEYMVPEVVC